MRTAAVGVLMVIAGVLAGRTTDSVAVSTTVRMEGESFSPETITIDVGDTVTWVNDGIGGHNARAVDGTFRSENLTGGATFSHTFTAAGTFDYLCTIHPSNMTGRVIVRGAAATATAPPPTPVPPTATLSAATSTPIATVAAPTATAPPASAPTVVLATATSAAPASVSMSPTNAPTAVPTATTRQSPTLAASATRVSETVTAASTPQPPAGGDSEGGEEGSGFPWRMLLATGGFSGLAGAGWLLLRKDRH